MSPKKYLKDKKVIVLGLGVFGGGVASAKFCFKHGAQVLVTDLRDAKTLAGSLKQFTKKELGHITFVLEEHRENDFTQADIIIVNPGVPNTSPFLKVAHEHGAIFENDASLFFRFAQLPTIGVTGTRGKTTTVNWIAQLLSHTYGHMEPIGNSSNNPLLTELDAEMKEVRPLSLKKQLHVAELSSWQLELLPQSGKAPHVTVITNIYPDHLNRYNGIEDYAAAKANIFKDQTSHDSLVLNYDNPWRDFFLEKKQ
jgi:UDP-N-acetylmuramoylalanine--D-glutamate ligase